MLKRSNFFAVFVGIESPDTETLIAMRKKQNTRRSIGDSVHKIYHAGMFVTAGFIVGFDSEKGSVAEPMIELIEESAIPIAMVGLLYALPNTQLTRRLAREGRLHVDHDSAPANKGDQCTAGVNYETKRSRLEILRDYRKILDKVYDPDAFCGRLERLAAMLDCSGRRKELPEGDVRRRLSTINMVHELLSRLPEGRERFWKAFMTCMSNNPQSVRGHRHADGVLPACRAVFALRHEADRSADRRHRAGPLCRAAIAAGGCAGTGIAQGGDAGDGCRGAGRSQRLAITLESTTRLPTGRSRSAAAACSGYSSGILRAIDPKRPKTEPAAAPITSQRFDDTKTTSAGLTPNRPVIERIDFRARLIEAHGIDRKHGVEHRCHARRLHGGIEHARRAVGQDGGGEATGLEAFERRARVGKRIELEDKHRAASVAARGRPTATRANA